MTSTWASLRWAVQRRSARNPRYEAVRAAAETLGIPLVELANDRTLGNRVDAIAHDHADELLVLLPSVGVGRLARESSRVCFIKGRVRASAVSPSTVVYIGSQPDAFAAAFRPLGIIVELEAAA